MDASGTPRKTHWRRWILIGLLAALWFAALPLPGPLRRVRERWWNADASQAHADASSTPPATAEHHGWDDADGTVRSTGASGTWTMHVNGCRSGQLRAFFGVSLVDSSQLPLEARVVQPESGDEHVTVSIPGTEDEMRFTRSTCSRWDVQMDTNSGQNNAIYRVSGHAKFDCAVDGGHVVGDVALKGCRF